MEWVKNNWVWLVIGLIFMLNSALDTVKLWLKYQIRFIKSLMPNKY